MRRGGDPANGSTGSNVERRLDLGCGLRKHEGFLGMDRFPLHGVDLVADLDAPLPFRDDCFDLIVAHHALEHVRDLHRTLGEVWRVGRPGAQVCIVGPYWAQGLNVANPYHRQAFNEHSPRFWTDAPGAPLARREYARPPQGELWGLASSDHRRIGFDLRCVRIEFFYFEEYWGLSPEQLTERRRRTFDVCEQILFHLVVFKPPMSELDLEQAARRELFDPPALGERRQCTATAKRRRFSARRLLTRLWELGRG